MSTADTSQLIVDIGRSFLQYCSECWPWTSVDTEGARDRILQLASRQREHVAAMIDLLIAREHEFRMGTYPTEYTDLHYIGLEYLLDQLKENQAAITKNVMRIGAGISGDNELSDLLYRVGKGEEKILRALVELQKKLADSSAA